MELNYKSFGQGDPVIILHGMFGTLDNWQTIAKKLAEEYTVFILDQRNHGRSPHAEEMNYPIMAEDLHDFMENNWIYKAHIIGHSMGGKTAMQFALNYPQMVDKLVIVDIAPKTYVGGHQDIFKALLGVDINNLETRGQAEEQLAQDIQELGVRQFLLKNLTRKKEGGFKWKMNLKAIHEHYQAILEKVEGMEKFEGPSLFIRGGRSNYVKEEDMIMIREKFVAAQLETVSSAGHWVHAEAPSVLLEKLQFFLAEE